MAVFQICTLVTNWSQYNGMKDSFLAAGFDEDRCTYKVFDNTAGNLWDPYAVINSVLSTVDAAPNSVDLKWVVFCHQDVVLDQGHGFDDLVDALESLTEMDPAWAVAGNAGVTERLELVRHIADPYAASFNGQTPRRTLTLDENLLVVKVGSGLRCSAQMSGFHFYGADLCLQAFAQGNHAYVVDFRLTHNSKGTVDQRYYEVQREFQAVWNHKFMGAIIASTTNKFALSRFRPVLRLLDTGRATFFAEAHPWLPALLLKLNQPFLRRSR